MFVPLPYVLCVLLWFTFSVFVPEQLKMMLTFGLSFVTSDMTLLFVYIELLYCIFELSAYSASELHID